MLLPYYVGCMNVEHAYDEATGKYLPFPGACLALDWSGEAGTSLQKCGSLVDPLWQVVPGTTGASHYEEPATHTAAFYQLIQ